MNDLNTQEKFIELRASGLSYAEISVQLKVSKTTLIAWSKKYRFELANLRAVSIEALQSRFKLTAEARIEMFGTMLLRLQDEFQKRDLSSVPTEKLIDQMTKLTILVGSQQRDLKLVSKYDLMDSSMKTDWSA